MGVRVGLCVAVVTFATTAMLKAVPSDDLARALLFSPGMSRLAAVGEFLLVAALLMPRTRCGAAIVASFLLIVFTLYTVAGIFTSGLPSCGCFGGWIRMSPWIHVFLNGLLLIALAPLAKPRAVKNEHSLSR